VLAVAIASPLRAGRTGFAHLFEHVMSSCRRPDWEWHFFSGRPPGTPLSCTHAFPSPRL